MLFHAYIFATRRMRTRYRCTSLQRKNVDATQVVDQEDATEMKERLAQTCDSRFAHRCVTRNIVAMSPVTRNCEYCGEPFAPTPGPMASKQRYCCTKHRVYASRKEPQPSAAPKHRLRKPKAKKFKPPGTPGDFIELSGLWGEISRMSYLLQAYNVEDYNLDEPAMRDVVADIVDDLIGLGRWVDHQISSTQRCLSETQTRSKIAKLRDMTGRTAEEADTARRMADKLERKLNNRLS